MAAISHLIEAEIPSLRRYARSLLPQLLGVDLVQDTLVRALEKAHLWQAGTNLRAWMFTMMHNQYVNYVRVSVRHGSEVRAESAGLTIGATQHVAIEFRDMKRALLSIPAEQRDVVRMVCIEGMAYEDVAKTLGVPIGTVRSGSAAPAMQSAHSLPMGPPSGTTSTRSVCPFIRRCTPRTTESRARFSTWPREAFVESLTIRYFV